MGAQRKDSVKEVKELEKCGQWRLTETCWDRRQDRTAWPTMPGYSRQVRWIFTFAQS